MFRAAPYSCMLPCVGLLLLAASGCKHFDEQKAITAFSQALDSRDFDGLKTATSDGFQQKALRKNEAVEDLTVLRLPTGEPSIVEIEELSSTERLVTVEVGSSSKKLRYKLVRGEGSKRWVVDDVVVRQKREGLNVAKSVTEQMDLLLSFREFLDAWDSANPDEILRVTTPELKSVLGQLPRSYLVQLSKQSLGDRTKASTLRPDAQMDENVAVVRLPGSAGELVVSFKLLDNEWKVADLAVEARRNGQHIPSIAKSARALVSVVEFLQAYNNGDKDLLQKVCGSKFFSDSIYPANLSLVELPDGSSPPEKYTLTMQGTFAEFTTQQGEEMLKFSLSRQNPELEPTNAEGARYLVEEVTLYELNGDQEKRLSAVFTAHATMHVFADALIERDLMLIRKTASADFNSRVWSQVNEQMLSGLPLKQIEPVPPQVIATDYNGAVTEITVSQGGMTLVYVLRNWSGTLRVDDVLMPAIDQPGSLKSALEYYIPVQKLANALSTGDLSGVQRIVSSDFNRTVWRNLDRLPEIALVAAHHLRSPLASISPVGNGDQAMIALGDERWGAKLKLLREGNLHLIDDIEIIAGLEPQQRAQLKETLRVQLAAGNYMSAGNRQVADRTAVQDSAQASGVRTTPMPRPAYYPGPPSRSTALAPESGPRNPIASPARYSGSPSTPADTHPAQNGTTYRATGTADRVASPQVAPLEETFGAGAANLSLPPESSTRFRR